MISAFRLLRRSISPMMLHTPKAGHVRSPLRCPGRAAEQIGSWKGSAKPCVTSIRHICSAVAAAAADVVPADVMSQTLSWPARCAQAQQQKRTREHEVSMVYTVSASRPSHRRESSRGMLLGVSTFLHAHPDCRPSQNCVLHTHSKVAQASDIHYLLYHRPARHHPPVHWHKAVFLG